MEINKCIGDTSLVGNESTASRNLQEITIDGQKVPVKPEYEHLLGKTVNELRGYYQKQNKAVQNMFKALEVLNQVTQEKYGLTAVDYLFIQHHHDKSILELATSLGVGARAVSRMFDYLGLPKLNAIDGARRSMTPQQRRELGQKVHSSRIKSLTEDQLEEEKQHRRQGFQDWWNALSDEERQARLAKQRAAKTPKQKKPKLTDEERREIRRRTIAIITPEQRSQGGKKGYAAGLGKMTGEQLGEIAREGHRNMTQQVKAERQRKLRVAQSREGRSKNAKAYHDSMTTEQRSLRMKRIKDLMTAEQRTEAAKKGWARIPADLRQEQLTKARMAAEFQPNLLESQVIAILLEEGLYAPEAKNAQLGEVYYTGFKNNRRAKKLEDGTTLIPDFKVKGQKKVIEIFGDYWHSKAFCEKNGLPDYKWNPKRMIEEYAKVGYECLVYWESELKDPELREVIKKELRWFVRSPEVVFDRKTYQQQVIDVLNQRTLQIA